MNKVRIAFVLAGLILVDLTLGAVRAHTHAHAHARTARLPSNDGSLTVLTDSDYEDVLKASKGLIIVNLAFLDPKDSDGCDGCKITHETLEAFDKDSSLYNSGDEKEVVHFYVIDYMSNPKFVEKYHTPNAEGLPYTMAFNDGVHVDAPVNDEWKFGFMGAMSQNLMSEFIPKIRKHLAK